MLGASENVENYSEFYELREQSLRMDEGTARPYPDPQKESRFEDDLRMMYEYDPGMLSLVVPLIFSHEFAAKFDVTNNARIVRWAMSSLDAISMNDLISYSMTGTTKVVSRDTTVQNLIRSSLEWPSWEQFSLWKIISAQNVPIESYLPMLEGLSAKRKFENAIRPIWRHESRSSIHALKNLVSNV